MNVSAFGPSGMGHYPTAGADRARRVVWEFTRRRECMIEAGQVERANRSRCLRDPIDENRPCCGHSRGDL